MSDSVHGVSDQPDPGGVLGEILAGLAKPRKALPSKLLYDATGSALFQRITELPTYYLTRTERKLLDEHAAEIVAAIQPATPRALVEFGASDENKAVFLLDAADAQFSIYVPIDISATVLGPIRERMQITHPQIEVHALAADFLRPLMLPDALQGAQVVCFLPGSTIGQYAPDDVAAFLQNVGHALSARISSYFAIGTDICRDPTRVLPAYNDPGGLSKAFNVNMLTHINHLTGSDFDIRGFGHEALWNEHEERIDIYLLSHHEQRVTMGGHEIRFAAGERIHTGMSYKYSPRRFVEIAARAGWRSAGFWTDAEHLFGIHLLEK